MKMKIKLIYTVSVLLVTSTVCFSKCDEKCLASCYPTLDTCSEKVNAKYNACVRACKANLECTDACEKKKKTRTKACQEGYDLCHEHITFIINPAYLIKATAIKRKDT